MVSLIQAKYTATYWAKNKIRCNALSPGGVKNLNNSAFNKRILNKLIPMNRLANKGIYFGSSISLFRCIELHDRSKFNNC